MTPDFWHPTTIRNVLRGCWRTCGGLAKLALNNSPWTDHERNSCQHQQQGRAAIPQCVKVFIPTTVAVPEATLMSRSSPASVAP